jgi:two-component system, response regulator PdtaR
MRPRWKVVIVDDHAPSRAVTAEAVTMQGGQVLGNGSKVEDVAHLVDKHRPDAVIMAVGLPDGDGVEAARRVMASGACPVVLLTSHTDFAVSSRAIQAGVLGFLAKPLRPEELGPALDVAVSRFRELSAVRLENETLKRTLETRKLVERAKSILQRQAGIDEEQAYKRLQQQSMRSRRSMREIAEAVILSSELHTGE